MEIRINKEIQDYRESIFFGLSARQLLFSLLTAGTAVLLYLGLHDLLGTELVSWLCVFASTPFALLGFFRYHGMPFESFLRAYIRSEFLCPTRLPYRSVPLYARLLGEKR